MTYFLQHDPIEGPGMLKPLFENNGFKTAIIKLFDDQPLPEDFKDINAVVILGGPMNVYEEDKYPYLRKEGDFIKQIIKQDIPCLGVCLGSQLLVKAVKSPVRKASNKEIGWFSVSLTENGKNDELFHLVNDQIDVFQWHEDTFELPEGAVLLAESATCKNQAFRLKNNIYGLQFHLEVTDKEIFDWSEKYFDINDQEKQDYAKQMMDKYTEIKKHFETQMDVIGANFLKIIRKRQEVVQ